MKKILERTLINRLAGLFKLTAGDKLTIQLNLTDQSVKKTYHGRDNPLYVFVPISCQIRNDTLHIIRDTETPTVEGILPEDTLNMVIGTIQAFTSEDYALKYFGQEKRTHQETLRIAEDMDKAKRILTGLPCETILDA